jgi:uncharacterized damage-inducible protein DinB
MDVNDIHELYRYNEWANDRVFDIVSRLAPDEFTRDLGNSYPSVRETLTHIVWAEWIWLQRWNGSSGQHRFDAAEFPDVYALNTRWVELKTEQRTFVESVTAERLGAVVEYVNLQGRTWRYRLWRQMYHVVNHSTYHRGQLTTMLRQLGTVPIPTDFLVFHDELDSGTAPRPRS